MKYQPIKKYSKKYNNTKKNKLIMSGGNIFNIFNDFYTFIMGIFLYLFGIKKNKYPQWVYDME
jgi:hypothetical protein